MRREVTNVHSVQAYMDVLQDCHCLDPKSGVNNQITKMYERYATESYNKKGARSKYLNLTSLCGKNAEKATTLDH